MTAARVETDSVSARPVVWVTAAAVFVAFLNTTIASVAFHSIELDFPTTPRSTTVWVLGAYGVVLAAFTVPLGRLADRFGHRRLLVFGLATFIVGSVLAGLAPSVGTLIGARAVQALGAAAFAPTALAIVLRMVSPQRLGRAIAALTAAAAGGTAVGPPLGGALVALGGWRAVFAGSVGLGGATLIAGMRILPESREDERARMPDFVGALLLAGGVSALAYALLSTAEPRSDVGTTLGATALGCTALLAFAARSRRHPAPVIEAAVLRAPGAIRANLGSLAFAAAFNAKLLCDVLFLGAVWGYSPAAIGAAITPGPVVAALASRYGGRLIDAHGHRRGIVAGSLLYVVGCVWYLVAVGHDRAYLEVWVPGIALTGVGLALAMPALTFAAVTGAPPDRLAVASGLNSMARQLAAVVGVASLVALIGKPAANAGLGPYRDGWWLAAALALAVIPATILSLRRATTASQPVLADQRRLAR